ncbi:hypothetical protein CWB41_02445 [Methylovirgula ligni]|uniref:Uncharacterized protein n=1 Tax=Methylovirgula ligni TaxID=569860 RepID=A0A3D9Z7W3_9HYPH|nr:hypothetical protein [Methylovirgula ligni]QAY94743.1 hypothetical protein CWB41_02445 [Methylovirgula ligni]REF87366.1 hypothetical protein DES32_0986 [Methylovirgula ligni]
MSTSTGLAKAVTALDVLVASGFALAGLLRPQAILPAGFAPTPAASVFAMYAAARTLPLAAFVLIAIFKNWRATLIVLGTLAGIIQFLDFFVGLAQHDAGKSIGPLVLALLQAAAVFVLYREPETRKI